MLPLLLCLLLSIVYPSNSQVCSCCDVCGASTEYTPDNRRIIRVYGIANVGSDPLTQTAPLMMALAVDNINSNTTILPNHFINFTWVNTQCSAKLALQQAVDFFAPNEKTLVGVLGGGCSAASEPVALLSNVYSLPQIAWSSTSPLFSDKIKFPYFMRLVSSDAKQALAWIAAAKHFGWTRVATLNSQESLHATLTDLFLKKAIEVGLEVVASESFPGSQGFEMTAQLHNIASKGVTIVFMACYDTDARTVFRLKNQTAGFEGDNIAFVGTDAWLNANFLNPKYSDNDLETIKKNIAEIETIRRNAQGTIGFTFAPGNNDKHFALFQQFEDVYKFPPNNPYADFAYDSAFVLALGIKGLIDSGFPMPDPITPEWRAKLHDYLINNTNYQGVSRGVSKFDSVGDGLITYSCLNVVETDGLYSYDTVGYWNPVDDIWEETQLTIWPDGTTNIPSDRPPTKEVYLTRELKWAFVGLGIIGCIIPVINAILLGYYWTDEHVKAATPPFLALILFATLLSMCTIFVIAVEPTDATCVIPHWFNHMAYWIIFSCLFVKTARVWWIFNMVDKKLRKPKPISTLLIGGVVTSVCLLAGLYLALWTGLDMMHRATHPDPLDPERVIILSCYYSKNWASALYATELAFLTVGVILAYKINKIKILKSNMLKYNESSHIALSIYSIIFVGLVIIPNIMWLSEENDTQYILSCVGILVINLTLNFVLYVPKWRAIWKGEKELSTSVTNKTSSTSSKQ